MEKLYEFTVTVPMREKLDVDKVYPHYYDTPEFVYWKEGWKLYLTRVDAAYIMSLGNTNTGITETNATQYGFEVWGEWLAEEEDLWEYNT